MFAPCQRDSWRKDTNIQTICKKARRIIGILYRQFCSTGTHSSSVLKLYIAPVRPHLEYAADVWNTHLAKDILSLERVQKFGLRICLRDYHTSYEYLLDFFKIPSLKNRRIFLSICTFYLIKNHLVHFPSTGFLPPPMHHTSTRIYNPFGYYLPHAHCNSLKFSFLHTVINPRRACAARVTVNQEDTSYFSHLTQTHVPSTVDISRLLTDLRSHDSDPVTISFHCMKLLVSLTHTTSHPAS